MTVPTSPAASVVRVRGVIDALSPIQHGGDEKTGSTPVLRSLMHWDPIEGRHVRLPFLSGNAIRGYLRRLTMHDLLSRIGYQNRSPKLHHALFTGGVLESTNEATAQADLGFRRWLREAFPCLALFGTAVGNQMVPSCLIVEHAIPICREYRAYLGEHADDPRAQHSVRTFTDVAFATRRDDLRAERERDDQAVQMLIEFEAFIPGTRFVHGFTLRYPSELEVACLGHVLALWREHPYVGGKSGSGYGRLQLTYDPLPDPAPYTTYLATHAAVLRAGLDELAARLGDGRLVRAGAASSVEEHADG